MHAWNMNIGTNVRHCSDMPEIIYMYLKRVKDLGRFTGRNSA